MKDAVEAEERQEIDRDQVILTCSMTTNYSEEYLGRLSDCELMEVYDRVMKK